MNNTYSKNVDVKMISSNFLKCTECDNVHNFIAISLRDTEKWHYANDHKLSIGDFKRLAGHNTLVG